MTGVTRKRIGGNYEAGLLWGKEEAECRAMGVGCFSDSICEREAEELLSGKSASRRCVKWQSVIFPTYMAIVSRPEPNVLMLVGELDLHESESVRAKIDPLIAEKVPRIVVDLTKLSYIDSSGIAIFIETMRRVQAYGGKLLFFGLHDTVRNIFEVARLDQVFAIYPDKESALAS